MDVATGAGTLAVGAAFGLALAAPPGPMNAVIAEESVVRGWLAGVTAGLGAMTADLVFFALSLAGLVAFLDDAATVRTVMVGVGGLVMLYFAYGALREARETRAAAGIANDASGTDSGAARTESGGFTRESGRIDAGRGETTPVTGPDGLADIAHARGFRTALVLALTNPYQILFWLTVGVGLLEPGTIDVFSHVPGAGPALAGTLVVRTGSPALIAGLFAGIAGWIVAFPAALVSVGERVDGFAPAVAALSAVVLAGFGVAFCWTALASLPVA